MKFISIRRHPERGVQDWPFAASVLDEALVAHVVLQTQDIEPNEIASIPMYFVRVDERICLHGAVGNGLLRTLAARGQATLSVALVDGLVLASSASFHSLNYRSVMIRGACCVVNDPVEKEACLWASIEKLMPGRGKDLPALTAQDLSSTFVLRIEVDQIAVKQRKGPPGDTDGVWSGVIPTLTHLGIPEATDATAPLPDYLARKITASH